MSSYTKALALWRRKGIRTDAELAEALSRHSIAFAFHSGKIENDRITFHDTREIFEHDGVTAYTGDLRTLFEIRNAREAYELFLQAFRDRRPLDETLIQDFQRRLTYGTYDSRRWQLGERPGAYKRRDYVTGRGEVGAAPEDVAEEMAELLAELSTRRALPLLLEDFLTGLLNKRLGQQLLKLLPGERKLSAPSGSLTEADLAALAALIKALPLAVCGVTGWERAQVMAGGLELKGFESQTLAARRLPGLFAAGELLDVCGDCGGYNLSWAWSSGRLAAHSAVQYLLSD